MANTEFRKLLQSEHFDAPSIRQMTLARRSKMLALMLAQPLIRAEVHTHRSLDMLGKPDQIGLCLEIDVAPERRTDKQCRFANCTPVTPQIPAAAGTHDANPALQFTDERIAEALEPDGR